MATGTTPIWGRPYPNETDTPDVAADIHSLALSLETTPLYPTTATASRAIVPGESVVISPSQTGTTSSTPTKGDIIQTIAHPSVTSTTPVTVAIGGGKVVNGVGLNGATSFLLGAPGARATIQYDGTAWRMIAGAQDTGLLPFASLASGFSWGGSPHAGARLIGNRVQMQSYLFYSGSPWPALSIFANLPLAIMEPVNLQLVDVDMGIGSGVYVQPGTIGLENQASWNSGAVINFNGITYLID